MEWWWLVNVAAHPLDATARATQMIRTIEQASGIQVQGELVTENNDGTALIEVYGKLYSGKLVPQKRKEEKEE